jgi:hypothetical protein
MTHSELANSPARTTHFKVRANKYTTRPDMAFVADHHEKTNHGVKGCCFYAATEAEALEKAAAYDKKRKELFEKWRQNRKKRS